jgi:hypothetical protein
LLPTAAAAHPEIFSTWKELEGRLARLVSLTRSRSLSE